MIAAKEARKNTEDYIKGRKKISAILIYLNDMIVAASEEGKSSVFATEDQIKHLSIKERKQFIDELGSFGYEVEAVYEPRNIDVSILKGYEIRW